MTKLFTLLLFTTLTFAQTNVIVSIIPQKIFVEKIGGDKVHTTVMVLKGSSPHNYTPQPSQMKELSKAVVYFSMNVEFEQVWLPRFQNQNKHMLVIDSSKGIQKNHKEHVCSHGHHHQEESLDPHVWVDPLNVKIIAKNICTALVKIDKKNEHYYKTNLENYLKELDELNIQIKHILKETPKNSSFMVFHPSWGYFAKRYELTQLAVEVDGKEPKMKALVGIIKKAKEEKVHAIFTQPEFSDKASQNIANNLNIEVIKASPLAENWSENLKTLAQAIAKKNKQ